MQYLEYRKLIKFGNSSHVISLPGEWIKKNNLSKGDVVYLDINGNSDVILTTEKKVYKEHKSTTTIDTKGKTLLDIKRLIISAYINDCRIIKIIGPEVEKNLKFLRDTLNNLVAIEIIEQSKENIVAQDFLSIKETSFDKIIRRMDILIKSNFEDINFETKEDQYENIALRDTDMNKLAYLGFRVIKRSLRDPHVSSDLKVTYIQLLDYWQIIMKLEKIGDSIKRISRLLRSFSAQNREKKDIINLFKNTRISYNEIMKAFYTKDMEKAREIANKRKNDLFDCVKFGEKYQNFRTSQMVENFKDLHVYIGDISGIINLGGVYGASP